MKASTERTDESGTQVDQVEVAIIGAGPAGLAAAAMIKKAGMRPVVFERANTGSSWRGHYDRLHLHTIRWLSNLPDLPFPRSEGKWVSRDGVVSHLERYVAHFGLEVRTGVDVERIDPAVGGWQLQTSNGPVLAWAVVVATGYNKNPVDPDWPGRGTFEGDFILAAQYLNPEPYLGRSVLVVGTGNSGAEIATDLAEQGVPQVWMSYRTPPNLIRRDGPLPPPLLGVVMTKLRVPGWLGDPITAFIQRVTVGDLSKYGLPPSPRTIGSQMLNDEVIPIIDLGIINMVKTGKVTPVPAVESLDGPDVLLADGRRITPDVVIACVGYRPGLEPLVGHLGLVGPKFGHPVVYGGETDPTAPRLHFAGLRLVTTGLFREFGIEAHQIAASLSKARQSQPRTVVTNRADGDTTTSSSPASSNEKGN